MSHLIEVAFKGNRKEFFLWEADELPSLKAPVIVDVRNRAAAQRDPRRIPGAIRLLAEEIDTSIDQLPPDREIILYCT